MKSALVKSPSLPQQRDPKKSLMEPSDKSSQVFGDLFFSMDEDFKRSMSKVTPECEKKVLMLYTGGAIGMTRSTLENVVNLKDHLKKLLKNNPHLCDQNFTFFNAEDGFLITPHTMFGKRIWYKVEEFDEIKDSCDNDVDEWLKIAEAIEKNYNQYDAFLILHGTDTMAYTASALSFMFENLRKTVILTGSQVPLSEMRNDAFENLLGALTLAGHFTIPEVSIYFRNKLFRGNRSIKIDAFGLEGFDSPNMPPLVVFGLTPKIDWSLIPKQKSSQFHVEKRLSRKVGVLKMYPSIPTQIIKNVLEDDLEACVIEGFGAGGLPLGRLEIREIFKKATEAGKILVVISQCSRGAVNPVYSMDKLFIELGLISGLDMTVECVVAKLSYLCGKKLPVEEIKKLIQTDMRGDCTEMHPIHFNIQEDSILQVIANSFKAGVEQEAVKDGLFPTLTSYAAHFGYIHVLDELKRCGTNFDAGDYDGKTPLHIAAKCGETEVIKYLIFGKVNLNAVNSRGRSALFEAILNKNTEAAKILIASGGKVIAQHKEMKDFLFKTVKRGDLGSLKLVHQSGLNNLHLYQNVDKRTIGHIAVAENQVEIIKFLKEETNFDFSVVDRWGWTPLSEASSTEHEEIIELLREVKDMKTEKEIGSLVVLKANSTKEHTNVSL